MKKIIFALTACLFFLLSTTDTFAQTKVKKNKVKAKQGVLKQPAPQKWIRDSMYYLKNLDKTPQTIGLNSAQASDKPNENIKKEPTASGTIGKTVSPQVKGRKARPKLQKRQAVRKKQGKAPQAKAKKVQKQKQNQAIKRNFF